MGIGQPAEQEESRCQNARMIFTKCRDMSTVVDGLGQTLEEHCVWLSENVWICGLIDDAAAWVLDITKIDILNRKLTIENDRRDGRWISHVDVVIYNRSCL